MALERYNMNILYVGNEIRGNFIQEISKKDKIKYTGTYTRVADYEDIIFQANYDVILFDVDNLIDDAVVIKDYFLRIKKAKNSIIIIVAVGYSYNSEMIEILINSGFKNFILATSLARQYEEYEKCLSGYYEENGIDLKPKTENIELKPLKLKSIGVCGTLSRIGTTTLCMQLVKYLKSKGYNACYVEVNSSEYIDNCVRLYADIKKDKENRYINFNDINMYTASNMGDAVSGGYNYIVCDYGSVVSPDFNKVSFLEKDLTVFVTGSKANEIETIQNVLQSNTYANAKYIFNFVPESDKSDIKEMMCEKENDTFFTVYAPDPFDYINNPDFEKMMPVEDVKKESIKSEKHSIFNIFKGGK